MDVPWGGQDPVALYQALLMKQSLAAAHASGMRFPNMHMPAANGMGMNMVDMAALASAAQAASASSGGRGGYGGGGGGGGSGYAGMDPHMHQGGYGRRDQRIGPRGDMGGGEYGMGGGGGGGPMGGVGMGPRMGGGGASRGGGGMHDVADNLGDGNVYHVQFKRSARNFLLGKTCQRDLQVRDRTRRDVTGTHPPTHRTPTRPLPPQTNYYLCLVRFFCVCCCRTQISIFRQDHAK